LRLYLSPDKQIGERQDQEEASKMTMLKEALTQEEKETIVQEAFALKKHQEKL
jgi:Zn-dependent M16 (insulinase) family peptidase